jgi:hypothetical protein
MPIANKALKKDLRLMSKLLEGGLNPKTPDKALWNLLNSIRNICLADAELMLEEMHRIGGPSPPAVTFILTDELRRRKQRRRS